MSKVHSNIADQLNECRLNNEKCKWLYQAHFHLTYVILFIIN